MQRALTLHMLNPHIQGYLLITGLTAQVRALGSALIILEQRYGDIDVTYLPLCARHIWGWAQPMLPPHRRWGLGLEASTQPHRFQGWECFTTTGTSAAVGGLGLSENREYDSYASLRLETIGVKPSLNTSTSPPKAKSYATQLRNENYAARGFL